jgi:hypothetical protein
MAVHSFLFSMLVCIHSYNMAVSSNTLHMHLNEWFCLTYFYSSVNVFNLMKYLQKTIALGHFTSEDGNVILPQNVGIPLPSNTKLYPRRMEPSFTQV